MFIIPKDVKTPKNVYIFLPDNILNIYIYGTIPASFGCTTVALKHNFYTWL